jgi:hypothetical protein
MNYVSLAVKLSVPVPRDAAEASQTIVPTGGIDGLPFEGHHSEDAFVDPAKRLLADKSCSSASIPRANLWSET